MNYEDIAKVNGEMTMLSLKGKDYAMVPERVTAFRKLFPDGVITTDIVEHDGTTVTMKATVGVYINGNLKILGTGYAQEVKGKGMVNTTSYIENCETSAVGRALGFLGLGINGGGICSAEELANAVVAQRQMKESADIPSVSDKTLRSEIIVIAKNLDIGDEQLRSQPYKKYDNKVFDDLNSAELRDLKQTLVARKDK